MLDRRPPAAAAAVRAGHPGAAAGAGRDPDAVRHRDLPAGARRIRRRVERGHRDHLRAGGGDAGAQPRPVDDRVLRVAHVVIGLLVSRGVLHLAAREVDPMLMRNWIRMALSTSLLAVLLAKVIDYVIRHVEANARATTRVLAELQVAYAAARPAARPPRGGEGRGAPLPRARAARRARAVADRAQAAAAARQPGAGRSAQRRHAPGAGAHRSADRAGPPDLRRPAPAAARRGRARSGAAPLPRGSGRAVEGADRARRPRRPNGRGWRPTWRSPASGWCRNRSPTPSATPPRSHIQVRLVRDCRPGVAGDP